MSNSQISNISEDPESLSFESTGYEPFFESQDAFKETIEGFDLNTHVLQKRLTDATEDGGLFGIRFG